MIVWWHLGALTVVTIVLTIIMHEVGHLVLLQNYTGKKVKLRWDTPSLSLQCGEVHDYKGINVLQYKRIIFAGIAAGGVPIIFLMSLSKPEYGVVGFVLLYWYYRACKTDRTILRSLEGRENDEVVS